MYTLKEVVGLSDKGYSEAIEVGIKSLQALGKKVAWFEVASQRGTVREGGLIEYQAVLKVAVSTTAVSPGRPVQKGKNGVCPTCGKDAGREGHLCVPKQGLDRTCAWCGAMIPDARHLCSDKVKKLAYICNTCGRTAVKAEHLCRPEKIKKGKKQ